eukprot:gnl/TRDRNA2_/TRDRNA2_79217_c2_seq1.p1 gnl/TRDRNA2_/TRDRNA2_79217_c2~~gnl/TRDRNA2_/TRDRNA2_79217_c2_seq1.p1  ORF type:complete len:457 (-),score=86.55 gnl/TRDRNA2_/TRDRNA2_79217_c2_seq1:156-1388(-)
MAVGTLPCQAIAASVTAYGRRMIEHTRLVVEREFGSTGGGHGYGPDVEAKVIYGDTDSVMVAFGSELGLERTFELGRAAAEIVSREFGAPVKMEFEKVYYPYLLMNKKRYAGVAWNKPEESGKLDAKGIEVVRRDWCELVRQVVDRSLHLLLRERSPESAIAYVQERVAALRQGRIDMRLLVLSKALVREGAEAYTAKQAHVELAEKMRRRDKDSAPKIGERVPYVFVAGAQGSPAYERAEDPLYAVERGLPIDADHYIDHQLKQPLLRIFEPVMGANANVEQRLFAGEHTRRISQAAPANSPLASFVRTRAKCLGCRAVLQAARTTLCTECAQPAKASQVMLSHLETLRPLEEENALLRSQCVRCEGSAMASLHTQCANVDCPIFFRRLRAAQDLKSAQVALEKLRLDW